MKKIPNWLIILVVLGLIIASKFLFFSKENQDAKGSADKKNKSIAVNYFVVKSDAIDNSITTTGKMGAMNQVNLIPEVNGKVNTIYFKEGQSVSKGELLLKLNDAELQAQLEKSKIQIKLSEQKLERLKKLLTINGVSQEEYDMQENDLASLKSDDSFLRAQLAKTLIVAPFDGVVGLKDISEGSFVNTQNPVVSIVQLKPMYVEFSIPEKYSHLLSKGLEISFKNERIKDNSSYKASIYAIEPMVDENTKTIKARALYNGNQSFYAGGFVEVKINFGVSTNALLVPSECVVANLKGQSLFICKNNVAIELPVEIGLRNDKMIQITKGISIGDTIVSTGLMAVRNESKLTLIKATK